MMIPKFLLPDLEIGKIFIVKGHTRRIVHFAAVDENKTDK